MGVLGPLMPNNATAVNGSSTLFMEPGSDADNSTSNFYSRLNGSCSSSTTQHHTGPRSISCNAGTGYSSVGEIGAVSSTAGRFSAYFMFANLPDSQAAILGLGNNDNFNLAAGINSTGKLTVVTSASGSYTVLATGTTTLSTNTWYRISLAYTITNSTVNQARVYLNGNLEVSKTNSTLSTTGYTDITLGWNGPPGATGGNKTLYLDDVYADNGNDLADTGDVRVTAKRPNANGSSSQFTTQIGSGGSGYGAGHSPQINERPWSTTNGWQAPTTSGTKSEYYALESASQGDIDISAQNVVAYFGWVYADLTGSGTSPTNSMFVNGASTSITLSATPTVFSGSYIDSSSYPATAPVIGINHTGTKKATQLFEAGMVVAYIPNVSITVSDGSVSYGVLNTNTSKDTTSGGLNDTQTATNNGGIAEDFNIMGQNSTAWTLAASTGSEQYKHEFCTTGSGSPDPCDASPTWTALTTSYQSLSSNVAVSGTTKLDLKITTPTSTSATTQQSVNITIQAIAH